MARADSDNSTPAPAAEKPRDSIYLPTDTAPEQLFRAIGKLRKDARDEIDRLIRFLDKTDDYVSRELEDSIDDNPHDDEGEAEPSLGSFDRMADQSKAWRQTAGELCFSIDAEQDDAESEPSLGSLGDHHTNQERWADGDGRDLEQDDSETGIGDQDGLDEQVPFRDGVGML
jgi:hypothetical protein